MLQRISFWLVLSSLLQSVSLSQTKKALFDNTKVETAGNADWIIDTHQPVPSPAQSGITQSTAETYWVGAVSAWGVELVKQGFTVHTLTSTYGITYGNSGNAYDLSNYNVFIVCEPQVQFTAAEKSAILSYVRNGGGLVMVADHNGSDRNSDGWDSPMVWNDLRCDSTFGIHFQSTGETNNDITQVATNVAAAANDSIIHGPAGTATAFSFHNGTTIRLLTSVNPTAAGHIWMNGVSQGTSQIIVATARYGAGRVAAEGDSSPADDGTGQSGNSLYDGWTESGATDNTVLMNMTLWAASALAPNPVQLSSFTAQLVPGNASAVQLTWRTISEVNNYGFFVEKRNGELSEWSGIDNSFVPGHGTTGQSYDYRFVDIGVLPGVWQYRLRQVDLDGTVHYTDPVSVNVVTSVAEHVPGRFALEQNYPNPFNPSTRINYEIPAPGKVTLRVYDVLGRETATLVDEWQNSGNHSVQWNAIGISSGMYFYQLKSGSGTSLKTLMLLK